jgi:rRNA maturation endonuclease Nob1
VPRARTWVLDTCALSQIHRMEEATLRIQKQIFGHLDDLVATGRIFYPEQVVDELAQAASDASGRPFPPYHWAKRNKAVACARGPVFEALRRVLAHPQAIRVLDPHKATGVDEADPHVLALAIDLQDEGHHVTVVTEDRRDKPFKLSLHSACGVLGVLSIPVRPFLVELELLPPTPP